jgi:hypothetical protein
VEHHGQPLGVGQRLLGEDQGEQAHGHGTAQQPARALLGGRVMGMSDQADHPGAGRRDRHRDREMAQHPVGQRDTVGSGQTASHQIEVDPPEAEAHRQRQHPGDDRAGVTLGHRQAVHDPDHDLAEHDDDEQPEAFDQRVGRGQAQSGAGGPGGQHDADDPGHGEAGPHHEPWAGREQGAGQDDRRRHADADHVGPVCTWNSGWSRRS